MSATAAGFGDSRAARFWNATIGKKLVMAISGALLFLFVVAHLLGNLQVFLGAEHFNAYARFLRLEPALLWTARIGLLVMVLLHIWASVKLAMLNKMEARPVGYVKKKSISSSYASRTMYWSGPSSPLFVIYHLMQFTWGIGGTDFEEGKAYENLVRGFQNPAIVGVLPLRDGASDAAPVSRRVEHVPDTRRESSAVHAAAAELCKGHLDPVVSRLQFHSDRGAGRLAHAFIEIHATRLQNSFRSD